MIAEGIVTIGIFWALGGENARRQQTRTTANENESKRERETTVPKRGESENGEIKREGATIYFVASQHINDTSSQGQGIYRYVTTKP